MEKITWCSPSWHKAIIGIVFIGCAVSALAHNRVVVVPLGEDAPQINMQCEDGGLEYSSCDECRFTEPLQCCAEPSTACFDDSECIGLSLCITNCSTAICVQSCRDIRTSPTLALYDEVLLCIDGSGEPNLDGACGLICAVAPPPPPPPPPAEDIYIELTWRTPGDPDEDDTGPAAGADLDLHFAHPFADEPDLDGDDLNDPWFDSPFDTFSLNPNPNWANIDLGVDDNPVLIVDDTDGKGPEIITLNNPESVEYSVGVYSTKDNGFGDSIASITIWSEGEIVYQAEAILRERDMWWVGKLNGGTSNFFAYPGTGTQYRISPNYEHPSFPL